MIERHNFAPGSPRDDGGDDGVDKTVILLLMRKPYSDFVPGQNLHFNAPNAWRAATTRALREI
jgi:hypothetical protein